MMFLPKSQALDGRGQDGGPMSTHPQPGSGSPKAPRCSFLAPGCRG